MLKQALLMAWRDWRSGEMRLLMAAIFLAVTALASVAFFSDRLNASLLRDAQKLLGGDLVIISGQPLPVKFTQQAQTLGLIKTEMAVFSSMGRAEAAEGDIGKSRLITLKAVDAAYPLKGELTIQAGVQSPPSPSAHGPQSGEVWVQAELLTTLGLNIGNTLLLGELPLLITQILLEEPDVASEGLFRLGPRVLMSSDDLEATGLVQPASRVSYRFAVVGEPDAINQFETWATEQINLLEKSDALWGVRIDRLETAQPSMHVALERAQKFLNLVALLAALLCAVAIILAARGFASRQLDRSALLRVMGQPQSKITFYYVVEFAIAGAIATLSAIAAGYGIHYLFIHLLSEFLGRDLPPASLTPVFYALAAGATLLIAFGIPPILQLAKVPPLRVLRRDIGKPPAAALLTLSMGSIGFLLLLISASGSLQLGFITVFGFICAMVLFALLAYLLIKMVKPLANMLQLPVWFRLAIRSISANPLLMASQISALAVGMLALFLLLLLRTDLITSWQEATPTDAPNRFVINIMPDEEDHFKAVLKTAQIEQYDWYPMIQGRLVSINGVAPDPQQYQEERARRLVDREFSLSYSKEPPSHNEIVEGRWIANEPNTLSVEKGLMETLGLKLGDHLSFTVGGMDLDGTITSVRRLDWSSMHVNFFVIFPLEELEDYPQTYITAFKAPDSDAQFDDRLAQEFPSATNINVSAMLAQIQSILDQMILAVEAIFLFTLIAGLIVLYATIASTREQRTQDFAVMRALGASNQLLAKIQRFELMSIGILSGTLSASAALVISGILIHYVFDFIWSPSLWVLPLGAVAGLLLSWGAGWMGLRSVLKTPVIQTLRTVLD